MQLLKNYTTTALLTGGRFFQQSLPFFSLNQAYSTMPSRAPVISICHGGGPLPIMGDPGHTELIKSLSTRVPEILGLGTPSAPRAIVMVTAHWRSPSPSISNGKKHDLYHDFSGFPIETYKLKYDAPGSPEVAQEVHDLLQKAGLSPQMDGERGWDHGVFVPMLLINPAANIPIVQVSVLPTDSPSQHYAMGRALAPLRDSGVAILGSGQPTFHNIRHLYSGKIHEEAFKKTNKEWSDRLTHTVTLESSLERGNKLEGWRDWVGAEDAHPQGGAEHFLPFIVCAGAGGEGKAETFRDEVMATEQYTYFWK